MTNITLFGQIMQTLDRLSFTKLVREYQTDKHEKGFNSWTHMVTMLFCQFSKLNSLRDVCNGLKSASGNLNHLGVSRAPCKSSLSYQNKHRESTLFKAYYYKMLAKLSGMAHFRQTRFKIKSKILMLDSTTISLCLSLYDWAKFRKRKGAIKLHTLLDYDGCLPVYMNMTDGKTHDAKAAKELSLPKDAVVVADRAYVDFSTLGRWAKEGSYFVIRGKESIKFHRGEEKPLPDGRHEHVLVDEYIELSEPKTRVKYPKKLRRVVVYDAAKDQTIELITNHFYRQQTPLVSFTKPAGTLRFSLKRSSSCLKLNRFWEQPPMRC